MRQIAHAFSSRYSCQQLLISMIHIISIFFSKAATLLIFKTEVFLKCSIKTNYNSNPRSSQLNINIFSLYFVVYVCVCTLHCSHLMGWDMGWSRALSTSHHSPVSCWPSLSSIHSQSLPGPGLTNKVSLLCPMSHSLKI